MTGDAHIVAGAVIGLLGTVYFFWEARRHLIAKAILSSIVLMEFYLTDYGWAKVMDFIVFAVMFSITAWHAGTTIGGIMGIFSKGKDTHESVVEKVGDLP